MKMLKSFLFLTIILGIFSLFIVPAAHAEVDEDEYFVDTSTYTVSVPAKLAPGEVGQVHVTG